VIDLFKKHKCETCGRKFRKIEEFMQHQQIAHEQRQYICTECNKGFDGMEQMRGHAKKFHSYNKIKGQEKPTTTTMSQRQEEEEKD
jgi:DNA-directed RNA polymerase subunit RPC12/RpoP